MSVPIPSQRALIIELCSLLFLGDVVLKSGLRRTISRRAILFIVSIIVVLCIVGGLSAYGILDILGRSSSSSTSTLTTRTTTSTTSSSPSTTSTTVTTITTTTSTEVLKELFEKLAKEAKSKEMRGYDVLYAEYLLLSAKYYYGKGDIDKVRELLEEAEKELKNARLLPKLPPLNFTVAENSLYVRRVPTVWDFVPIGTVFVLTDKGYLEYPRNDPTWRLSCFIIIAMGCSSDGEWFGYQGRLPLAPREGLFRPRVFLGGEWHVLDIVFTGPLYYDVGGKYGYPMVYQYDLSGNILQYILYVPSNRTWKHEIIDLENNRVLLSITAKAVGAPMWLGEWNRTYLVHGIYNRKKGVDLWSGFWDICVMEAKVNVGGVIKTFEGVFIFDRASHRVYKSSSEAYASTTTTMPSLPEVVCPCRFAGSFGLPLAFTCMVIYQEGLNILVASSVNPSPWDPGVSLQHQLRINLLNESICIDTTSFQVIDDGTLQPKVFRMRGEFEGGYFNLTGRVISFWPSKWTWGKGTWWNKDGVFTWGRAFIMWTGEVVVNGRVIGVNAIGVGEFTRYSD